MTENGNMELFNCFVVLNNTYFNFASESVHIHCVMENKTFFLLEIHISLFDCFAYSFEQEIIYSFHDFFNEQQILYKQIKYILLKIT